MDAISKRHELSGIEFFRFFCAFAILVYHYHHFFLIGEYNSAVAEQLWDRQPFYAVMALLYDRGALAVQVFWVISGFIFYWHYADQIQTKSIRFFEFGMRRFSRLYPLHFATLLLVALEQYIYFSHHGSTFIDQPGTLSEFVSHLLFASNWFYWQPFSFNSAIWSVSAEILIYLAFFLVVAVFGKSIIASGAACFCFLFLSLHYRDSFQISRGVITCGMFFFAGCVRSA